jgi:hypothetical protein
MNKQLKLMEVPRIYGQERPTELREKESEEIWNRRALEVIENGWSSDSVEEIKEDLKELFMTDNGFEKAKDLESMARLATYNIDTLFIEWLDDLHDPFDDALREHVKGWVIARNIQPKLAVDTKLRLTENLCNYRDNYKKGGTVFIAMIDDETAEYVVGLRAGKKRGVVVPYERLHKIIEVVSEGK